MGRLASGSLSLAAKRARNWGWMTRRTIYVSPKPAGKTDPKFYLGFLEARDAIVEPPALSGPGWPSGFGWRGSDIVRLGFSAVASSDFRSAARELADRDPPTNPDLAWRRARRQALETLFKAMPTYNIELFFELGDAGPVGLQTAFQPGGWFALKLRPTVILGEPVAGLISRGREGDQSAVTLSRLLRVSADEKRRLRRVFSLNHVGDLGSEEPDGEPTPEPPIGPELRRFGKPDGSNPDLAVIFGASRLSRFRKDEKEAELQSQISANPPPTDRTKLRLKSDT